MADENHRTLVELKAWLTAEELEAVTRWAREANCPDIGQYLASFLSEEITYKIRWEESEKKRKEGPVDFDDEIPFCPH